MSRVRNARFDKLRSSAFARIDDIDDVPHEMYIHQPTEPDSIIYEFHCSDRMQVDLMNRYLDSDTNIGEGFWLNQCAAMDAGEFIGDERLSMAEVSKSANETETTKHKYKF